MLWSELAAPSTSLQIAGNDKALATMRRWFSRPHAGQVLVVSGPMGVGKSLAVALLAAEHARQPVLRPDAEERLPESMFYHGRDAVLLLDDVDVLNNAYIKRVHGCVPVVVEITDRYHSKVKTLLKQPFVVEARFYPLSPAEGMLALRQTLRRVAQAGGNVPSLDSGSLKALLAACNGDVRQAVHALQFMGPDVSRTDLNPFDATKAVLTADRRRALQLLTNDRGLIQWAHQSYLSGLEAQHAEALSACAAAFSASDAFGWEAPRHYAESVCAFGLRTGAVDRKRVRVQFPVDFAKTSSANANARKLDEFRRAQRGTMRSSDAASIRCEWLPFLARMPRSKKRRPYEGDVSAAKFLLKPPK